MSIRVLTVASALAVIVPLAGCGGRHRTQDAQEVLISGSMEVRHAVYAPKWYGLCWPPLRLLQTQVSRQGGPWLFSPQTGRWREVALAASPGLYEPAQYSGLADSLVFSQSAPVWTGKTRESLFAAEIGRDRLNRLYTCRADEHILNFACDPSRPIVLVATAGGVTASASAVMVTTINIQ